MATRQSGLTLRVMSIYTFIYRVFNEMFNAATPSKGRELVMDKYNLTAGQANRIRDIGWYLCHRNTDAKIASGELTVRVNS